MTDIAPAVATPCPECPFNRTCTPGALGGSTVEVYVGQIYAPYIIACHMHIDYSNPNWRQNDTYMKIPQCAGAATMRANLGLDAKMPKSLPRARADRARVFADMAEFVAHHLGLAVDLCRDILTPSMIYQTVMAQLRRPERQVSVIKREENA